MTTCVSLATLAADGIPLSPAEAVTVVAEICRQVICGEIPGIPSAGAVSVSRDGQVHVQGPTNPDEASVPRAGQLLDELLPGLDVPATHRASGALRLVIARALGTLDLPPFSGLDEFHSALGRFAGADPAATARSLFRQWPEGHSMPNLRARATWIPSVPPAVARVESCTPLRDRSAPFSSALALVALLAVGGIAIVVGSSGAERPLWSQASDRHGINPQLPVPGTQGAAQVQAARQAESPAVAPPRSPAAGATARPRARRAMQPRRVNIPAPRRVAVPEPRREVAAEPRPEVPRPRSFLDRELFTIVIK